MKLFLNHRYFVGKCETWCRILKINVYFCLRMVDVANSPENWHVECRSSVALKHPKICVCLVKNSPPQTNPLDSPSVSHPDAPTDAALPGARRKTSRSSGEAPCHVSTRLYALTGLSQLSVPLFCFYAFWSKTVKTIEIVVVANRGETGEEKWGRKNHNWHAKHINRMPEWHVSSLGRFCHVLFTQKILQFILN